MKWKKIGHIFDPKDHPLSEDFFGYAQSPQTLELNDSIRVYFSTRKKQPNGKFVSLIQYVDFSKDFSKTIQTSKHEVIGLGKLGTFDEHGIFPINVCQHDNRILAYTTGWTRRNAVSVDTGIGLAESKNHGDTFERLGDGPVLTTSLNEPFLVCDGFVKHYLGQFHMFYIYGKNWQVFTPGQAPERTYVIGHATSNDGINWQKTNKQLITQTDENECQALPTVIEVNNKYHMLFCYRNAYDFRKNPKNGYRLGYAFSEDLIHWHRQDDQVGISPSHDDWDSDMMCYPHLCKINETIFLLYNGNEFGRYGFGLAELEHVD